MQPWYTRFPRHLSACVPWDRFAKTESGRVILFVNTWNHMFGEANANANERMMTVSEYDSRLGSRELVWGCGV